MPVRHRFDAEYDNVDLTQFTNLLELQGIRLAGRATGRNLLEWPSGRFADRQGGGEVRFDGPPGVELMTRRMPIERLTAELAARLEAEIRKDPGQYFWFHKRWKTAPPEELRGQFPV